MILFSYTPSLCCSCNVRDHVSHPYKTTARIIIFCFNLYIVGSKQRILNCILASISMLRLFLISSWNQFWFIIIPIYINFATFLYIYY
jgi:hypothetical protein